MSKSIEVLEQVNDELKNLATQFKVLASQQLSSIENFDMLLNTQNSLGENQATIITNQATIIKNQSIITHNQSSIIHNQEMIVKNQAYLKTFLHFQTETLALLRNSSKDEVTKEVKDFLNKTQKQILDGIEKPI